MRGLCAYPRSLVWVCGAQKVNRTSGGRDGQRQLRRAVAVAQNNPNAGARVRQTALMGPCSYTNPLSGSYHRPPPIRKRHDAQSLCCIDDQTQGHTQQPSIMASPGDEGGHTVEHIRSVLKTATLQQQQAVGVLLGTMVGDVLGAAVEGCFRVQILCKYPEGLKEFQPCMRTSEGPAGAPAVGNYTDDFQMTLALAESLVESGTCNAEAATGKYCEAFQEWRGYGETAVKILKGLKAGALEPRTSGTALFPTGSFANGGAMRIAPVGFCYRNASDKVLHKAVEEALVCTHVHPEGIDGAFVLAAAVAAVAQTRAKMPNIATPAAAADQTPKLLALLQSKARTEAMKQKLSILEGELEVYNSHGRQRLYDHQRVLFSVADGFQIRAVDAVSCVLWIMCTHWEDPRAAVEAAAEAGGDTDTIAAMTGALCGALHGADWIPDSWLGALENGKRGRDHALEVAWRLAALDITE